MSHFTKCELKMTNLQALKKALEELQLQFQEAEEGQGVVVRGYRGDTLKARMSIDMGKYDIGVIANANGGARAYPMQPYMGLLHTALSTELAEFVAGTEDAEQALADVKAAYDTAAREAGFLQ